MCGHVYIFYSKFSVGGKLPPPSPALDNRYDVIFIDFGDECVHEYYYLPSSYT